jgi:CheY-like chemotaxis protein
MMGGDIFVESEVGRGTTFTFQVPAVLDESKATTRLFVEVPKVDLDTTIVSQPASKRSNKVLVIDDDVSANDLICRVVVREGFTPVKARSGREGIRLAKEERPDLITLDVKMPGMDGWSVLTQLKMDPNLAHIPVVIISMVDDKDMGFALGAAEYLSKPVDRAKLTAVLKKIKVEARV